MKVSRWVSGGLLGLGVGLASSSAAAWVETRVVASDVRVELERSGTATIDHAVTMQIKGGPLRAFDLAVADANLSPLDGTVVSAQTESQALPIPATRMRFIAEPPLPVGRTRENGRSRA